MADRLASYLLVATLGLPTLAVARDGPVIDMHVHAYGLTLKTGLSRETRYKKRPGPPGRFSWQFERAIAAGGLRRTRA